MPRYQIAVHGAFEMSEEDFNAGAITHEQVAEKLADLGVAVDSIGAAPAPVPFDGWQYGVVMYDGRVWGCGEGESGRARQRMRLRYEEVLGPCLIGPEADIYDRRAAGMARCAEERAEVERLREIERAARVYFREFDHLIGGEYPERADLRQALAKTHERDRMPDRFKLVQDDHRRTWSVWDDQRDAWAEVDGELAVGLSKWEARQIVAHLNHAATQTSGSEG